MKAIACKTGTRAKWLALAMVCGMALTTSAYAQFTPPESPFMPAQKVGAVVSMPMGAFGPFVRENVLRQKNVNFLNFSQVALGDGNFGMITASVRQWNGAPTNTVFIPAIWLDKIQQINKNHITVDQFVEGSFNTQVAQVEVDQSNQAQTVPWGTHFCMIPTWALPTVLQVNKNVTKINQVAVGDGNTQLAMVGVSQNNQMLVPTAALATIQINTNVTVINQVAIGRGNFQMAQVQVGQANM